MCVDHWRQYLELRHAAALAVEHCRRRVSSWQLRRRKKDTEDMNIMNASFSLESELARFRLCLVDSKGGSVAHSEKPVVT